MIGVSLRKIYMSGSPENICDIHKFSVAQPVLRFTHHATVGLRRDRGGATGTVAASRVFTHRTVAAARNRASGFGGDWRVRQQLPVGVGPDDRMPPGSREPKVSPPPEIRTTETT